MVAVVFFLVLFHQLWLYANGIRCLQGMINKIHLRSPTSEQSCELGLGETESEPIAGVFLLLFVCVALPDLR